MDRLAIGADPGDDRLSIAIAQLLGWLGRLGAPAHRLLESLAGIVYPERDVMHSVAMAEHMVGNRVIGNQGGGQDQPDLTLLQDIARPVAGPGFRASIGNPAESEPGFVEDRGLFGVPDVELDEIGA